MRTSCSAASMAAVIALASAPPASADPPTAEPRSTDGANAAAERTPWSIVLSSAYFHPLAEDRRLHSIFANALVGGDIVRVIGLGLFGGATLSSVRGDIIQWGDDFEEIRMDAAVAGAGPMLLLSFAPFHLGPVSPALEAVGSLVLYNQDFPPGGDIYNFSWRFGGSVRLSLSEAIEIGMGARWMHVSNGQGLGPQNPSYEAVGVPITITLHATHVFSGAPPAPRRLRPR